jgi:hypothetical protein
MARTISPVPGGMDRVEGRALGSLAEGSALGADGDAGEGAEPGANEDGMAPAHPAMAMTSTAASRDAAWPACPTSGPAFRRIVGPP